MANKNWIKSAIKRPGRETRRAQQHGVSVHRQMETDSRSPDASLRAAGQLGLRLASMSKKRKPLYSHPKSKDM